MYLPNPLPLHQGALYRARLELTGAQKFLANAGAVMSKFSELGFSDVTVWKGASNLPHDWPSQTTQGVGGGTWFVEGRWTGVSMNVDKPDSVWAVWEA